MELEVRTTAATDNCFVSLPLSLLQTLQSTSPSGFLPPVLALELRSRFGDRRWHVAWSGSASRSSAIEVSQLFSECISLPDRIKVQVKIIQNLPKAEQVAIEPCTADDWEIMELNQELARDTTLQQVGVVYEGMKFPLSLGHAVVIFVVVSTLPNKVIAQLVPGVEFIVAPKLRTKASCSYGDVQAPISEKKQHERKGLLRVQEQGTKIVHKVEFEGLQLGVVLTSAVFVHPETARSLSFRNLQLVRLLPRLSQTENISRNEGIHLRTEGIEGKNDSSQNKASPRPQIDNFSQHEGSGVRRKEGTEANNDSSPNKASPRPQTDNILHHGGTALRRTEDAEGNNGNLPNKASPRHTIVRLLLLDCVARGHVMIPRSLCRFIEAGAHSWVYIVEIDPVPKNTISSLTLSPCQFKLRERGSAVENVAISSSPGSRVSAEVDPLLGADIQIHKEFISSLSCISPKNGSEKLANKDHTKCKDLIQAWLAGQLKEIALYAGGDVESVVLTSETLFHFEVTNSKYTRQVRQESSISPMKITTSDETPVDLLYLLSIKFDGTHTYFEFFSKAQSTGTNEHNDSELNLEKLELEVVSLDTAVNSNLKCDYGPTISSLSWLETAASNAISRLETLLAPFSAMLLSRHHCPLPGHILIYGPPGSGKTSLTKAIARYFEDHEKILAHIIFVSCSKLPDKSRLEVKQTLKYYISEALVHSPSLLILDDLDHIVYSSSQLEGAQATSTVNGLVEFLADVVDECETKRQNSCGYGPIAFMASAESLDKLPQSLVSAGRLGLHIVLPTPAAPERAAMLKHEVQGRSLQCGADILSDVATKCDGYDSYDLDIMLDRAVHVATSRYLSSHTTTKGNDKPLLVKDDFSKAMQDFSPVTMRGLSKMAPTDERSGWADVGGLVDIRKAIQEMIEMPSRFPSIFAQAPLRLKSNVLLYGPPGCGKTHIVGAAAAACSLRFKSVKGPELLNKYIGASEQAVRDLFRQAAAAAPCILFFDEFDSIAPKRGHDSTGVTDRVVNQFLTELDGVETLRGVFVFAATSRPDLIDAALLRPGRLDRLLFCDFPTWTERVDVLTVLSRKLPLASDVNLETIASMTEGFSGADLQALLSDSQLAAVHEILDDVDSDKPKEPLITDVLLRYVALKARPSVSETEKRRLNAIYDEFVGARKSVSALSRDAKGKRATLA